MNYGGSLAGVIIAFAYLIIWSACHNLNAKAKTILAALLFLTANIVSLFTYSYVNVVLGVLSWLMFVDMVELYRQAK